MDSLFKEYGVTCQTYCSYSELVVSVAQFYAPPYNSFIYGFTHVSIVACCHPLSCCIYTALIPCLAAYILHLFLYFLALLYLRTCTSFNILIEMFLHFAVIRQTRMHYPHKKTFSLDIFYGLLKNIHKLIFMDCGTVFHIYVCNTQQQMAIYAKLYHIKIWYVYLSLSSSVTTYTRKCGRSLHSSASHYWG